MITTKAPKIDIEIYGKNHPAVAIDYNNLGGAWNTLGDSKKAIMLALHDFVALQI
ncbi:MAG: tetratricopeptide repeat protein [Candidatus Methanofastidiosia archaeon]